MTVVRAHWKLVSHAVAVLALTVCYAVLWVVHVEAPDAGPLSVLGLLPAYVPLALLGLPWSILAWIGGTSGDGFGGVTVHLLLLGPAWVNLGIHALLARPGRTRPEK